MCTSAASSKVLHSSAKIYDLMSRQPAPHASGAATRLFISRSWSGFGCKDGGGSCYPSNLLLSAPESTRDQRIRGAGGSDDNDPLLTPTSGPSSYQDIVAVDRKSDESERACEARVYEIGSAYQQRGNDSQVCTWFLWPKLFRGNR